MAAAITTAEMPPTTGPRQTVSEATRRPAARISAGQGPDSPALERRITSETRHPALVTTTSHPGGGTVRTVGSLDPQDTQCQAEGRPHEADQARDQAHRHVLIGRPQHRGDRRAEQQQDHQPVDEERHPVGGHRGQGPLGGGRRRGRRGRLGGRHTRTTSTGRDESAGRSSCEGGSPRATTRAPRAATIAPLSVHSPAAGSRSRMPAACAARGRPARAAGSWPRPRRRAAGR